MKGYTGSGVSGGGIRALAFSPDGRFLASGSGHGDMKIQIWYGGRTHKATLTGHTEGITSIAFHPNSRTLASGSSDQTVLLWDVT
ncbi:serine/threonine protein kinase, partial [Candidatus Poribacteria bacterium]|nr:serine/threonine protein kinase [Candidatus Poribacteria bacterium]